MAKAKRDYPNTPWGREAEDEDIEEQAKAAREEREPGERKKTFDAAMKMLGEGKSAAEVTAALDTPAKPLFTMANGVAPMWAKVDRDVEESMVFVRQKAIADAVSSYAQKNTKDDVQKSED